MLLAGRRNASLSLRLLGLGSLESAGASLEQSAEPNCIGDTAFAETVAIIQWLAALAQALAFGKTLGIPEGLGY